MRSVKSYCNVTLFKKNLTRFWPVWGLYLVIWLFVFPINLILDNYRSAFFFAQRTVLQDIIELGLPMAVVFSLLAAMAVWSYLCNNRSVCLMHTLPIRREGLFLTNFLSGMAFMVIPNLIIFVLTLLAEMALGEVDAAALAMWLVSLTLMELFFFSFATFCAMFTGHILGLPAFYSILNGLVFGVMFLLDLTLSRFVFGFTGAEGLYAAAKLLTPIWMLSDGLDTARDYVNGEWLNETTRLTGFEYIAVYAVVGLILAGLALLLYRRRDMERAGDVITVPWMRPIFQYGVAFCSALAFGSLLFEMFRYALSDSPWLLLVFMLICGAVGWFIARMLVEKSFRVFRYWKECVPLLAALVLLVCIMEFDVTGFERRVPDADEVASVLISDVHTRPYDEASYMSLNSEDPQVIQAALALHQTIVDNKNAIEGENGGYFRDVTPQGYSVQPGGYTGVYVIYELTNGKIIRRDYDVPVYVEDLNDPKTVTARLDALINLPQVVEESYGLFDESADKIVDMSLTGCVMMDDEYDEYLETRQYAVDTDDYEKVFEAVMADFAEGNIGRRYLMDDEERQNNCFNNDLRITFIQERTESTQLSPAAATVLINDAAVTPPSEFTVGDDKEFSTYTITVTLQTTSRHTLAALAELGVLEESVNLITQAQMGLLNNEYGRNGDSWTEIDLQPHVWDTIGG